MNDLYDAIRGKRISFADSIQTPVLNHFNKTLKGYKRGCKIEVVQCVPRSFFPSVPLINALSGGYASYCMPELTPHLLLLVAAPRITLSDAPPAVPTTVPAASARRRAYSLPARLLTGTPAPRHCCSR
jgi:hypothetical protein